MSGSALFYVQRGKLWKRLAKVTRQSQWQLFKERDRLEGEALRLKAELHDRDRTIRALKRALENQLTLNGAGTSDYARSQPSDACEIELWKAHAEGAWEDLEELRKERDEARALLAKAGNIERDTPEYIERVERCLEGFEEPDWVKAERECIAALNALNMMDVRRLYAVLDYGDDTERIQRLLDAENARRQHRPPIDAEKEQET